MMSDPVEWGTIFEFYQRAGGLRNALDGTALVSPPGSG